MKPHTVRAIVTLFLLFVLQAFTVRDCLRNKNKSFNQERMPSRIEGAELAPLHKVAAKGQVEAVEVILQRIDNFTEGNKAIFLNSVSGGTTALGKAIKEGSESIVQLLIRQPQIDVNKTGGVDALPALLLALKCKQPEIAKTLLKECSTTLNS
ncbi:ankyrin repeat domain-containing protein [Cardinium endosymbiont of Nabis limbatus]|uniref:ankyrin repeat domain-containing protein n=1 Tax=Cardinium endosymbiont of Nabis limbatus TaxID=3066217 RepID=UPI003AF3745D